MQQMSSAAALHRDDAQSKNTLANRIARSLLRYHGSRTVYAEYQEQRVTAIIDGLKSDMQRTHQALMRRGIGRDDAAELLATWLSYAVSDMRREVLREIRERVAMDLGLDPTPARERGEER